MRTILLILVLCPAGVFAADKKQPAATSKASAAEYESHRSEERSRIAEISAIERSDKPGKAAALKPMLSHRDPLVRGEAALAIGRSRDPAAFGELSAAIKDDDDHIRWGAVEGLAELGDKKAVPPLITALSHKDRNTRWKAAQALGKLKDARAADPLIGAARADKDRNVRLAAIEALMNMGGRKAIAALEGLSSDPDPEIRTWAGTAAGKLKRK